MQIIVEGTGAVMAILEGKGELVKVALRYAIEKVGYRWERAAKYEMDPPVDTGRYRASIGHWSPGSLTGAESSGPAPSPADALWSLKTPGKLVELTVGTNVNYAGYIEANKAVFARATDSIASEASSIVRSTIIAAVEA